MQMKIWTMHQIVESLFSSSLFWFCGKHCHQKKPGEERAYCLTDYSPSLREAKAGTEAMALEECYLLDYFSWLAQLHLLYQAQV